MMTVRYYYNFEGETCDRCGNFIKNVYVFSDGVVTHHVGCECIKKVVNTSDYGLKVIKSYKDRILKYEAQLQDFQTRDYTMISQKYYSGQFGWDDRNDRFYTEEEFKANVELMITFYLPGWIKNTYKELDQQCKSLRFR